MRIHELKCWPEFFQEIWIDKKKFEIRKNDRDYAVGDYLVQREYEIDKGYTGRVLVMSVPYLLDNPDFVKDGFVVMSIDEVAGWTKVVNFEKGMKRFFGQQWENDRG